MSDSDRQDLDAFIDNIWIEKGLKFFETVPADLKFMKSKLLWRNNKFDETAYLLSLIDLDSISQAYQ